MDNPLNMMVAKILLGVVTVAGSLVGVKILNEDTAAPVAVSNTEDIALGSPTVFSSVAAGDVATRWQTCALVTGDTSASSTRSCSIRNTEAFKRVVIDYAELDTQGAASSTFRFYIVATSSATIPASHDYHAIDTQTDIDATSTLLSIRISTSTAASASRRITVASSTMPTYWEQNNYIHGFLQVLDTDGATTATCARTGQNLNQQQGDGQGACEAATSTNRGITPRIRIRYHWEP